MAEYVDAVATFFKADESMVLLQFFETVPRRTQDGEIQTKQEISASILMSTELAKEFASGLASQLLNKSENTSVDKSSTEEN